MVMQVPGDWKILAQAADSLSATLAQAPFILSSDLSEEQDQTAEEGGSGQIIALYSCETEEEIIDLAQFQEDPSALNQLLFTLTEDSLYRNRPVSMDYLEGDPPMIVASFLEYATGT